MNYLIIGGNATGMSAASKLRKNQPDAIITVIEKGAYVSFGACGLPYFIGDEFTDSNNMIARSAEAFKKSNIDILLHHEALNLDHKNKSVSVSDKIGGTTENFTYDKLLISTGATPIIPPFEGIQLKGIHTLTKMEDGIALKEAITKAQKIVIVGGGFIGIETAEAFLHQGKKVTIIERLPRVAAAPFDPEITEHLEKKIREHKVDLRLGESVLSFEGKDHIKKVITDQGSYDADLVILAIGFAPATKWCANILKTLPNGAIIIDEQCKTSEENIYAGGDCATVLHAVSKKNHYIPLATSANKLGRILGDILADIPNTFQGTLGSSGLRFMDLEMGRTGLSEQEAKDLGIDFSTNLIQDYNHTNYVPGQSPLHIKLIYEKMSHILLGAQIAGKNGAVLRVDALAVAIFKKMTTEELGMMDFIYSPPFARTWDALNIAGNTSK